MHRTGRYRKLNLVFGIFPFVAAVLLALMHENSPPVQLWLSIVSVALVGSVHALIRRADTPRFRQRSRFADHVECVLLQLLNILHIDIS